MVASLVVLLIGLALCAIVVWVLREHDPSLLSTQQRAVQTWFDHLIHRH
ncbi:hypothetical protein OR16_26948 [Cupriavidus basilensis OR16]|uniref:Uncharacterized protein n=1 Tax=Cupriavidus basilensis OR16 TaxID=1127483 RepID=H1SB51_9BURK|nr:hypothetical protein OR16_26948 [Cupriavidus basilensis OR16]